MNRIRELRKQKNMTMKELGKLVGVSESTISLYENDKHEPDLITLGRIADALDVTVDELLGREVVSQEPWDVDTAFSDPQDDTIRIMARGMGRLSPENRQKLLDVAKTLFAEDFDEEGNKK